MNFFTSIFKRNNLKVDKENENFIRFYNEEEPIEGENLFKWHYNELLKTLIIFSSSSDFQIEITGIGDPTVEMVEEFIWHYVESKNDLISLYEMTETQITHLDKINSLINKHSNKPNHDFWNYECLSTNQDWIEIRKTAKECLSSLNAENLTVKSFIENKYEKSNRGKKLVMQSQKIELVNKDSH
jgi:hypothetical protein